MNQLLVIVPSRGRPQNVVALLDAWDALTPKADLIFGFDDDDPTVPVDAVLERSPYTLSPLAWTGPRLGMCGTLNEIASFHVDDDPFFSYRYLGFMGDDHRPRTPGWDTAIIDALDALGTGIVYGNDLVHGEALPTAVFMTSDIVRALGYMAPPTLQHLFLDNFWRTLGEQVGMLTYLPEVIIEHVHPIAQKAEWDEGYERVNAPEMYEHDRAAFEQWQASQMALDVAKVRALRAVRA